MFHLFLINGGVTKLNLRTTRVAQIAVTGNLSKRLGLSFTDLQEFCVTETFLIYVYTSEELHSL